MLTGSEALGPVERSLPEFASVPEALPEKNTFPEDIAW